MIHFFSSEKKNLECFDSSLYFSEELSIHEISLETRSLLKFRGRPLFFNNGKMILELDSTGTIK
jgi:hypothetical protein